MADKVLVSACSTVIMEIHNHGPFFILLPLIHLSTRLKLGEYGVPIKYATA